MAPLALLAGVSPAAVSKLLLSEDMAAAASDALDFFVEHLSAYERRLNVGKFKPERFQASLRKATTDALVARLQTYALFHFRSKARAHSFSSTMRGKPDDADDIICVIPYYGEGLGKGQAQSALETRKLYLEATFWSVRALTSCMLSFTGGLLKKNLIEIFG